MTKWTQRVGAYAVCIREDDILLTRLALKDGSREWTLPGGGVDPGEDPYDAAIREVYEETGYSVRLGRLLGVDSIIRPNRRGSWHGIRIVYTGQITGGELRDEVGGSTDTARWFPLAEVPALTRVTLVDIALRLYREQPVDGHNA